MLGKIDEEKATAEAEIRLFLRLFPILAAHFKLNPKLVTHSALEEAATKALSHKYQEAAENELQGDKAFVHTLPSAISSPDIKKPILDDK